MLPSNLFWVWTFSALASAGPVEPQTTSLGHSAPSVDIDKMTNVDCGPIIPSVTGLDPQKTPLAAVNSSSKKSIMTHPEKMSGGSQGSGTAPFSEQIPAISTRLPSTERVPKHDAVQHVPSLISADTQKKSTSSASTGSDKSLPAHNIGKPVVPVRQPKLLVHAPHPSPPPLIPSVPASQILESATLPSGIQQEITIHAGLPEVLPEPRSVDDPLFAPMILQLHNSLRDLHHVPHLVYNNSLAEYSRTLSEKCEFKHSDGEPGENMGYSPWGPLHLINLMYTAEEPLYDYNTGQYSENVGHMTQIIWRSTTSVGCWATTCPSLGDLSLLFCAYWPAGNYIGEFQDNVPKKSVASNAHVASVPREVHMKSTSQPSSKSSSHKGTVGHKLPVLSNTLIHDIKEAAGTFKQPPEPVSAHDELFAPMMLEMHNQLRALHPNTSPLRYNFTLAAYAKQHTDKCKYEHSDSPYGESIGQEDNQPLGMVNWWYVGEVKKFDFAHGGFSEETGHMTQIVWRETTEVGCWNSHCRNFDGVYKHFVACEYSPSAGSETPEYRKNVTPPRIKLSRPIEKAPNII